MEALPRRGIARLASRFTFFTEGEAAAIRYIENTLADAAPAREWLKTYIRLASADGRAVMRVKPFTIDWEDRKITARVDALLREEVGYSGRVCVTSAAAKEPMDETARRIVAAPPAVALTRELAGWLGDNTLVGIEVWELRHGIASMVSAEQARAAWPELLDRLAKHGVNCV